MALSDQEKQIVEYGKAQGRTSEQIKRSIMNYRMGVKPKVAEPQKPGFFSQGGTLNKIGDAIGEFGKERIVAPIAEEGSQFIRESAQALKSRSQQGAMAADEGAEANTLGGFVKGGLDVAGEATGFGLDVLGSGFRNTLDTMGRMIPGLPDDFGSKTEESIGGFFKRAGEDIAEADLIKPLADRLADKYVKFEQENPDKAQDVADIIADVTNIVSLGLANSQIQKKPTNTVNTTVNNHITSAKQALANSPKAQADMPGLLAQTQKNIVDQLRVQGLDDVANAVNQIKTTALNSIDDLGNSVQQAISTAPSAVPEGAIGATSKFLRTTEREAMAGARGDISAGAQAIKQGVNQTKQAVTGAVDTTLTKGQETLSKLFKKKPETLENKISPKLTARETRAAMNEGRVIRGAESKLFGRDPDTVILSPKGQSAAQTIQRRIPNAAELDDAQLLRTSQSEISKIAQEIAPEMKKVTVGPDQTARGFKLWEELKKQQLKDPEFEAFAGSKRFQSNFQEFLDEALSRTDTATGKARQARTLDDLWNIRKRYDSSIRDAVKNADGQSSATLQFQKDMWLDNRAILNNIINDAADGLGEKSARAFKDMSDLYWVNNNLAQKAKIAEEGTKGLFQKNIVKILGGVIGGKLLLD